MWLPLVFLAAAAGLSQAADKSSSRAVSVCTLYSDYNQNGAYLTINDYVEDLAVYNFDNQVSSVCETGLWIFYDNLDFNYVSSLLYWVHGIDFCTNFPQEYTNMATSIRYGGSPYGLNEDSYTLYDGAAFTGQEFYEEVDQYDLGQFDRRASSLILSGKSPWTFYTGSNWSGSAWCIYPTTDQDVGPNGEVMSMGLYPNLADEGVPDNAIMSVRKGCWVGNIIRGKPLEALRRTKNGAMGVIRV